VTDNRGCQIDTNITITEPTLLEVTGVGTQVLCTGDANGTLTATGTGGTVVIGNLEYSIDNANWQSGNIFTDLTAGDYRVYVRDENGCIADSLIEVMAADTFFIDTITPSLRVEYLDTVNLLAQLNNTTGVVFEWTNLTEGGILVNDSMYAITAVPVDVVTYEFTATNAFGCEVSETVQIDVEKPRRANGANGFTPNGDGVNDRFFIQGGTKVQEVAVLRVFDRWGELVFEGTDMPINSAIDGWDGTFRGQDAPSGMYVWYAEIIFQDGHKEVIKGDITLLR
jgi:gliding motility-associated-like protein